MSEQKLVSPLLDGFQMGAPISSHDGVRCCPAIKENSDNKYIIKILSIPASQNQLEALLLTGAFQDAAGALNYFRELADGVVREAQLHQQLARLKGFVPCEGWQVVPMEDNQLGYDVYLLTPYRRTLERYLKRNTMTHLEAVNLGLDLCAALAACRRAGYIYVDLKPSNIFISDDKEYLIGDLGFISMDSMKYAALPSKYRSCYSAPELHDVFSTIGSTTDIYALGLILYQVYNNGTLPFDTQPPAAELAPPANADYEMAEIILKACHPDPAQRWQNPTDMGQALVAYMQRNTINDVPIIPPVIPEITEEEVAEDPPAEEVAVEEVSAEEISVEEGNAEEIPETAAVTEEAEVEDPAAEEAAEEETAEEVPAAEDEVTAEEEATAEEASAQEASEDAPSAEVTEEAPAGETEEPAEEAPAGETEESAEEKPKDSVAEELAAVYDIIANEEIPEEADIQDLERAQVSDEISEILAQAEELAAHEIPEPVVVPDAKLPEEEPAPQEEPAEPEAEAEEEAEAEADEAGDEEIEIPIAMPNLEPVKKAGKKWLAILAILVLLAGLAYGVNYYYQNYYLVPVDSITLEGDTDRITADIDVALDESILTAVCTDTYGNTVTSAIENGKATFEGLKPGMQYTVTLKVDGFYKLTGNNSASFTTIQQTNIVSISATTGAEDGSVILSFTVDGTDPENWTVEYVTEGAEPQTMAFTGHMVTLTGLTMDVPYTFRLMPTEETDVALVGTDTLEFIPGKVILAENIAIESFHDDVMTVRWSVPAGTQISEWTVRCTSADGYDQTLTVTDCTASFSGVAVDTTYTLEILAQGMTQSARAEVTPKLLTVTGISCTPVDSTTLRITWEYEGDSPADGWAVEYSSNGEDFRMENSETNAFDLSPVIPGETYTIRVAGAETTYEAPAAGKFSGHGISADDLTFSTCIAPADSGWDQHDVGADDYSYGFTSTQKVGLVVYSKKSVQEDNENVQVLYLLRYADGTLMDWASRVRTMNWADMWNQNHFCTTLPEVPNDPGTYTVEIYFDGALALAKEFKIQ